MGERDVRQGKPARNKGGRPKKEEKKDRIITMKCSLKEYGIIHEKANAVNVSVSEYLREIAMTGKINLRQKSLPKEVLKFMGDIHHIRSCLNQITKICNTYRLLSAMERAELRIAINGISQLENNINNHLK
jgi:hypothetical protein